MSIRQIRLGVAVVALALSGLAWQAGGQTSVSPSAWADPIHHSSMRAFSSNIIVPQSRSFAVNRKRVVAITGVKVGVVIAEQVATTTMDISLRNPTGRRLEAELLVPVPDGAVVRGFTFQGKGAEPTAEVLRKDQAVATYKAIVARIKDPALLEFAGYNMIRSSVFPVEARAAQKIRLTYEHILPAEGDRVDYVLPRTESIDYSVPWEVSVRIKSARRISTVYSPSHKLAVTRGSERVISIKLPKNVMSEPGPLQLSYLLSRDGGMSASLLAYPDATGGYFLLLAGLPPKAAEGNSHVKREITVVIDRSGSMTGAKLNQARAAALQVVQGIETGETFNIIDYSGTVASFAPSPVVKTAANIEAARQYIRKLQAGGGTNLHGALMEALRPKPAKGMLPIVLFLTDGLATIGVRGEVEIRTATVKANRYNRRIFTFGVGYDVNSPLLTHLADKSRGISTFVLPNENVEAKVSRVFGKLAGPVLSAPVLTVLDAAGKQTTRRLRDVLPRELPDMFEGDQLVLLGRYEGSEPLRLRLTGEYLGKPKTFEMTFWLDKATTRNSFVPRLWASRRIAALIDEIRQSGAGSAASVLKTAARNPKMKELVDEIVRLSVKFGVLTEYTAFLAKEGTDLAKRDAVLREARTNFKHRAISSRVGMGSFNQAMNVGGQLRQTTSNRRNAYLDPMMNRVQITSVQQINDRAFFRRGNRWVDGASINSAAGAKPDKTVAVGSREFMILLARLVRKNRQGTLSLKGEILLRVDDKNILIKGN